MKRRLVALLFTVLVLTALCAEPQIIWHWSHEDADVKFFRYQMDGTNDNEWTIVDSDISSSCIYTFEETPWEHTFYLQTSYDGLTWSDSATNTIKSSDSIFKNTVEQKEAINSRFSYGVSLGHLNSFYTHKNAYSESSIMTPGAMLGLNLNINLDNKAHWYVDFSYDFGLNDYLMRIGNNVWFDTRTLTITNSLSTSFGFSLKTNSKIPVGFKASVGAALINTTLNKNNVMNIGPCLSLDLFLDKISAKDITYRFLIGGKFIYSLWSNNSEIKEGATHYTIKLGFAIAP